MVLKSLKKFWSDGRVRAKFRQALQSVLILNLRIKPESRQWSPGLNGISCILDENWQIS